MNGPASEPDERAEPGLERGVEHRQVGAEVAVALLHAQGVERAIAERFEPELGAGGPQPIPDGDRPFDRRRQLPAELAGVADPGGVDRRRPTRMDRRARRIGMASLPTSSAGAPAATRTSRARGPHSPIVASRR